MGKKAKRYLHKKRKRPVKRYALIGGSVGESYSAILHQALAGGSSRYDLISIDPAHRYQDAGADRLRSVLRDRKYRGFNVTIPYKREVIPELDRLSEEAARLGAVNTVRREADGRMTGFNTDLYGFMVMMGRERVAGRKAAVLGTGGAASAAAEGLRRLGAEEVVLVSRDPEMARSRLAGRVIGYPELDAYGPEVLVNATPVGSGDQKDRSPLDGFPGSVRVAADLIYDPLRTRFLQDAAASGAETVSGLSMLIYQAIRARRIWDRKEAPDGPPSEEERRLAYRAAEKILEQKLNIVVIGMPGSGKSSITRRLAKTMGRPFTDTDRLTAAKLGAPIPETIREKGEAYFREYERAAVLEACAERGAVIATGGGSVMDPESRRAIAAGSLVLYLDRPLEKLAVRDRPISQAKGLSHLYEERKDTYDGLADIVVRNTEQFGAGGDSRNYNDDLNDFVAELIRRYGEAVRSAARSIAGLQTRSDL